MTQEQLIQMLEDPIQRPHVIESLRVTQPDLAQRIEANPEQFITEMREGPIAKFGFSAEEKEAVKRVCLGWASF